jgi:hypothetical protein
MNRIGWTVVALAASGGPAGVRAEAPGEAVLENRALRLAAGPGQPGVAVHARSEAPGKRLELAILPAGAASGTPIAKAEVVKNEGGRGVLRVTAGAADAELTLGAGFVKIAPGKDAASVEVRAAARYAVLPDFFADDVVFDPVRFAAPALTVPAENFLLQFVEGGSTLVMCIWPGNLKTTDAKGGAAPGAGAGKEGPEPQVDLVFSGEGRARRIAAARIEFRAKPVYVGVIEQKGLWQDEDVGALPGYRPTPLAWKRPFEARWRGDFVVAAGRSLSDWPTRSQSFDFKNTRQPAGEKAGAGAGETDPLDARFVAATSSARLAKWWEKGTPWWERGDENAPQIWQESLASFFIYPAVFKGDEVRLCLYADKGERDRARRATDAARKTAKDAPEVPPAHVYERVIIYPLGRVASTPVTLFTPIDLMRETLGQGPCEYVLDLAGVKPRQAGGDRPILSYATCGLWNDHIQPILRQVRKKPDGSFEPLDEKTKAHLTQAIEEMGYFVRAVHDRLREYKTWGADTAEFCRREAAAKPSVKPIADRALALVDRLNADIGRHKFEGPGSEADWNARIPELLRMVKADAYADVGTIGKIRDLGNEQDERVSRCRQYVKGVLQEILMQDLGDPDVRRFAGEVRDRCHRMLRNMHPKEGF